MRRVLESVSWLLGSSAIALAVAGFLLAAHFPLYADPGAVPQPDTNCTGCNAGAGQKPACTDPHAYCNALEFCVIPNALPVQAVCKKDGGGPAPCAANCTCNCVYNPETGGLKCVCQEYNP